MGLPELDWNYDLIDVTLIGKKFVKFESNRIEKTLSQIESETVSQINPDTVSGIQTETES